jgi:hypothetical protein
MKFTEHIDAKLEIVPFLRQQIFGTRHYATATNMISERQLGDGKKNPHALLNRMCSSVSLLSEIPQ